MDTKNYLELDFKLIRKILKSSELHITSEIEVFNAADNWISHNIEEKSNFAKSLLLTVRLSLLSDPALNFLLNQTTSSICSNLDCRKAIEKVMFNRKNSLDSNNTSFSRYCNQNLFDIMFCEWEYSANNKHIILKTINGGNLKTARTNSKWNKKRSILFLKQFI